MKSPIIKKGNYGYIRNHKAVTAVRTALYFAVSIGLYVAGYVTTGTNRNLLTVVAVLGCLPACKSMVNFILFLRASGCSEALHEKLAAFDGTLTAFYDLYFTSYQKNYAVSHMALKGDVLCGITEDPKCACNSVIEHLERLLAQEGIKKVKVQMFSQDQKYIDRLSQLKEADTPPHEKEEDIIRMLHSVSI